MSADHVLRVFLTVDTELWPTVPDWPTRPLPADKADFADEIAADIHGQTSAGAFGLPFQIARLNRHGLHATYFVEALFAARAGPAPLAHIAALVQSGGHEVQLHLHTEWLGELDDPELPPAHCQYLSELPLEQQTVLIRKGLANLAAAGVPRVHAFRAGSYGANLDTLRALARNGIAIDSSYNAAFVNGDWGGRRLAQPQAIDGVWEFPIASFGDFPGHARHAQLCACSFGEMRDALQGAWRAGWYAFVIVLHSFELVKKRGAGRPPTPHRLNIRRFEQLCAFLGQHRERFRTSLFSELPLDAMPSIPPQQPVRAMWFNSLRRVAEQGWSRFR